MSYIVTLSPSGREISVEPGETILVAARRLGLPLNFNCERGSCGECRARILEGRLAEHLHHDYTFKGTDRQHPMLLTCRAIPASDMMIEMQEVATPTDIPVQTIDTQVMRVERLGEDIAVLHLRTPRSRPLQFLAGQYASLIVDKLPPHHSPIASCPCNGRDLQFHVHRQPDDAFSNYVFDHLGKRDVVTLDGPRGNFVLSEDSDRPMVFIAIDQGFAPIKSLIEHAISLERTQPMYLIWLAQDGGHYLANQCRAWRDALDTFHFELLDIAELDSVPGLLETWRQADFYLNGLAPITDRLSQSLRDIGIETIVADHIPHSLKRVRAG